MATATICLTRSVTLAPGEAFIVPPGGVLIGTTSLDDTTSVCSDLTDLEQFDCYVTSLAGFSNPDGLATFFEQDRQDIIGFELNGVYTAFSSIVPNSGISGTFDMDVVLSRLQEKLPAVVAGSSSYAIGAGGIGPDYIRGARSLLLIQTLPSIAKSLRLVVETSFSPTVLGPTSNAVKYYSGFLTLADAAAQSDMVYVPTPTCPIISV